VTERGLLEMQKRVPPGLSNSFKALGPCESRREKKGEETQQHLILIVLIRREEDFVLRRKGSTTEHQCI